LAAVVGEQRLKECDPGETGARRGECVEIEGPLRQATTTH
jgi:hypothetical protein